MNFKKAALFALAFSTLNFFDENKVVHYDSQRAKQGAKSPLDEVARADRARRRHKTEVQELVHSPVMLIVLLICSSLKDRHSAWTGTKSRQR